MTCRLRWEQCCEVEGCKRPARYGVLCSACTLASTPARRAVEMMAADAEGPVLVDREGELWLRAMFVAM